MIKNSQSVQLGILVALHAIVADYTNYDLENHQENRYT